MRLMIAAASALALLSAVALADPEATHASTLIWQGFTHVWNRKVLGFETPHRLATFGNAIVSESHTMDTDARTWSGEASTVAAMTPGVDGDWATITTAASAVHSHNIYFRKLATTTNWTDTASRGDAPVAKSHFNLTATVMDDDVAGSNGGKIAGVLAGIHVNTYCDPHKQKDGDSCNSDGMWPTQLGFHVGECTFSDNKPSCEVSVDIERGWTPEKGGGKPFNYRLDFNVTVYVTSIHSGDSHSFATEAHNVSMKGKIRDDPDPPSALVPEQSRTRAAAMEGGEPDALKATQEVATTPMPGYTAATVGMQSFQFDLSSSKDRKGRYIASLGFRLTPGAYEPSSGNFSFSAEAMVTAPSTVVQSDVSYKMKALALFLKDQSAVAKQLPPQTGKVCVSGDDILFNCDKVHMPNNDTTVMTANYTYPLNNVSQTAV